MDRLIVFYDVLTPISHFGWGKAFCGAEPVGDILDRHGRDIGTIEPCPRCVASLPSGERHIYRTADSIVARCGHIRDSDLPATPGIDPYAPDLCERCWTGLSASLRIPPAISVPIIRPGVWSR